MGVLNGLGFQFLLAVVTVVAQVDPSTKPVAWVVWAHNFLLRLRVHMVSICCRGTSLTMSMFLTCLLETMCLDSAMIVSRHLRCGTRVVMFELCLQHHSMLSESCDFHSL